MGELRVDRASQRKDNDCVDESSRNAPRRGPEGERHAGKTGLEYGEIYFQKPRKIRSITWALLEDEISSRYGEDCTRWWKLAKGTTRGRALFPKRFQGLQKEKKSLTKKTGQGKEGVLSRKRRKRTPHRFSREGKRGDI